MVEIRNRVRELRMVRAGEPVLVLHLWNERMPRLPQGGPDLAWAVTTHRLFVSSLRSMARHLQASPELSGIVAIFAVTSLFNPESSASGAHPMQRLGFTVIPHRSPSGRFGEFWENFYAQALAWAYNPSDAGSRHSLRGRRTEIWILAAELLARYGQ